MKNGPSSPLEAFDLYYQSQYQDRWPILKAALITPPRYFARPNLFSGFQTENPATGFDLPKPSKTSNGLLDTYLMDYGSLVAAQALGVQPGHQVLDLCSAPGGKLLILAEALQNNGFLWANELSSARRNRLKNVVRDYLPQELGFELKVTGHDASRFGLFQKAQFDRVLVDVPCSSERHVLHNSKELALWSPSRSRSLAKRQYAILTSALLCTKVGGNLLYSTCSISREENDSVLERLLKRKSDQVCVLDIQPKIGEKTSHGWILLPDETSWGPIYFSLLQRTA